MHPGGHLFGVLASASAFARRRRDALSHPSVDDVSFGAWLAEASLSVNLAILGVLRPFAGALQIGGRCGRPGLPSSVQAQRPCRPPASALVCASKRMASFSSLVAACWCVSRQRYLISDPNGE